MLADVAGSCARELIVRLSPWSLPPFAPAGEGSWAELVRGVFLLGWSGCVLMRGRVSCVREGSGRTRIEMRSWRMAKKKMV